MDDARLCLNVLYLCGVFILLTQKPLCVMFVLHSLFVEYHSKLQYPSLLVTSLRVVVQQRSNVGPATCFRLPIYVVELKGQGKQDTRSLA